MPLRVWQAYLKVLHTRPMITQMVQTGTIMGAGDILSQVLFARRQQQQQQQPQLQDQPWQRTARFAAIGFFYIGPSIRVWYVALERIVGHTMSPSRAAISKMILDQFAFAPVFTTSVLSLVGLLQGHTPDEIVVKLKAQYIDVMKTGYSIWPAVQLANFFYTPFLLRPLVTAIVSLFWNTYLAWKTNNIEIPELDSFTD